MVGVVACETLSVDVERIAPDADVRYVRQELHEFPVNVPLHDAIVEAVQSAVDELDAPDRDRIAVCYANGAGDLAGVQSEHAPLVVSRTADCVSTLLPREEYARDDGDPKTFGTFYVTRGTIDRGVDSYKLYSAYAGTLEALVEEFEVAARDTPGMTVSWHDGDRFRRTAERDSHPSSGSLDAFFYEVVQYYDRVALLDTGALTPFHHEYARRVAAFIERLQAAHGDEGAVSVEVIEGDTEILEALLETPLEAIEHHMVDVYPPGTPIAAE